MNAKRVAVLGLLMAGCGSTQSESLEQFCAQAGTQQLCWRQQACGIATTDAPCEAIINNTRVAWPMCDPPLLRAVDAGVTLYDGVQARQCLADLRTVCGLADACNGVFTGTVMEGGACHTYRECAGNNWCDRSMSCPGACVPKAGSQTVVSSPEICGTQGRSFLEDGGVLCLDPQPAGASCGENSHCEPSLRCREGLCATPAALGETCVDFECGLGLRCEEGACIGWARRGEPCALNFSSPGALCQRGLACRNGVCGDALQYGEICGFSANDCGAGLRCALRGSAPPFFCVHRGTEGVDCVSSFDCETDFACVQSRCTGLREAGRACVSSGECKIGLRCLENVCTAPSCSP